MVGVSPRQLPQVEGQPGVGCKGPHELIDQLGVKGADLLGGDGQFLIVPATAGQVHSAQDQSLVHGQAQGGVPPHPPLLPQSLVKGLAQGDADVLHAVVIIHLGVPITGQLQIHPPVAGQQGEHMVQKAHAGPDPALPLSVQVQGEADVRLIGLSRDLCRSHKNSLSFSSKISICSRVPMVIRL